MMTTHPNQMQRIQPLFELEGLISAKEFRLVLAFRGVVSDNASEYQTAHSCAASSSFRTCQPTKQVRDSPGDLKFEAPISVVTSEHKTLGQCNADESSATHSKLDVSESSIRSNGCSSGKTGREVSAAGASRSAIALSDPKEDEERLPLNKPDQQSISPIPDSEYTDIDVHVDASSLRAIGTQDNISFETECLERPLPMQKTPNTEEPKEAGRCHKHNKMSVGSMNNDSTAVQTNERDSSQNAAGTYIRIPQLKLRFETESQTVEPDEPCPMENTRKTEEPKKAGLCYKPKQMNVDSINNDNNSALTTECESSPNAAGICIRIPQLKLRFETESQTVEPAGKRRQNEGDFMLMEDMLSHAARSELRISKEISLANAARKSAMRAVKKLVDSSIILCDCSMTGSTSDTEQDAVQ
jgi:hypothetical protein